MVYLQLTIANNIGNKLKVLSSIKSNTNCASKKGILPVSEGQAKGRTIPLLNESDLKEFSELHEKRIWEDRLSHR